MSDPTYIKDEIDANPAWELAFTISEIVNDNAPLGWSKYIFQAECLLRAYDINRKAPSLTHGEKGSRRHHGFDCNNTPGSSGSDPSPF